MLINEQKVLNCLRSMSIKGYCKLQIKEISVLTFIPRMETCKIILQLIDNKKITKEKRSYYKINEFVKKTRTFDLDHYDDDFFYSRDTNKKQVIKINE